ncbi:MAG: acyl-CoA dehydrogenase family protein [Candidatus Microthrix subdominans]|nr:acyl-CoA dehydrogenase family protein [Candidatus Microthrix sp.]MBK7164350.1 acyl-CoA dehydrogenase family protein [Candidatus Microthrix sp.]
MSFTETPEQLALREAVAQLGAAYGYEYMVGKARSGGDMAELYAEAGKLGYLGVNLPTEYGGGGGGMYELAIVEEELGTAGCGLLMMVVSPAICGTVIAKYGTDSQKDRWLPGLADGSEIMAFAITESDAGSNSHRITTTARRDGDDWVLSGAKTYISGVDVAQNVLVVARTEDSATGALKPVLFVVPTDSTGLEYTKIEMDMISADHQFTVFIDDVRLPSDALVGSEDAAIDQLFAGLNPERIMASSFAIGMARYALNIAVNYAKERVVWRDKPIGSHQGVAHPLAQAHIEVQLAKLMMQKAATLYDQGDHMGAGETANMAKYAAGEAGTRAVDQAVQTLGGNGLASEYGLGALIAASKLSRIAPVSREMILNFIAQHSLDLPKSY